MLKPADSGIACPSRRRIGDAIPRTRFEKALRPPKMGESPLVEKIKGILQK
jgi:hypothetical protein